MRRRSPARQHGVLCRAVAGLTLACFLATQTLVLAGPHEEGTAAGEAANPVIRGSINAASASSNVPGYTTTPAESAYYGQPNLSSQGSARLTACAFAVNDPVCQAQVGATASANTPRPAISPTDPAVLAAARIAGNPATALDNIASYYSGCQVTGLTTPARETRVCRQYLGAAPQSCAQTLAVSVARSVSCNPGDWLARAGSGTTTVAVQCVPDRPASAQHFRVTSAGMGPEYVDVDLDSGWVFPRMVAKLPPPDTALSNGQNGVWFVDNLCVGDNCHLTALIAQEYRRICADGSPDPGDQSCPKVRPFLEVYDDCGVGTQSGNNIVWQATVDGEPQTGTLHEALCYQPTRFVSPITGTDITGKVPGTYWIVAAHRQVIGWKLNPPYGPVPQMALRYERPHTTVNETDHWDDQCAGLAAGGRCTIAAAAHCVDGPATKDIDGDAVWRNCWRYETALSCASTAASNECTGLVAAGCTPVGTVCRQTDAATGTCQLAENTYSCPVAPGSGVSVSNCPANVFCLQGSCFNISAPADADFAQSMSFMEAAREAGVYLDTDTMQVFKGEANACRDRLLKNCCYADDAGAGMSNQSLFGVGSRLVFDVLMNADNRQFVIQGLQALLMGTGFSGSFTTYGVTVAVNGTAVPAGSAVLYSGDSMVIAFDPWSLVIAIVIYVVMSMMSCSADEGKLAMKEGARLCHTVGTYCSSCLRLLGRCVSCLETSTGKCCFNSLLARLINEQGRQQIAKGWGAADTPDCSGFTVAQLQSLNFAAMDLREFYASLVPTLPDVGALQGRNATLAADCYYGQGKCP